MLNRTNRTLSANSNRLNLGTRSLAQTVSFINVAQAQTIRHDHLGKRTEPMRIRMGDPMDISLVRYLSGPSLPSSPLSFGWSTSDLSKRVWSVVVAEAPPVVQEVVPHGHPCPAGELRGQCGQPATSRATGFPTARSLASGG
jgi:hypothetical protein